MSVHGKMMKKVVMSALVVLSVVTCSRNPSQDTADEESAVLAKSSFYSGESAPGFTGRSVMLGGGESGAIEGPASGSTSGGSDSGSIPAPSSGNNSTSSGTSSTSSSGDSSSTSTPSGSTSTATTDDSSSSSGGSASSTDSGSSTTSSSTSSGGSISGSDGGVISGGGSVSGDDGGVVSGSTSTNSDSGGTTASGGTASSGSAHSGTGTSSTSEGDGAITHTIVDSSGSSSSGDGGVVDTDSAGSADSGATGTSTAGSTSDAGSSGGTSVASGSDGGSSTTSGGTSTDSASGSSSTSPSGGNALVDLIKSIIDKIVAIIKDKKDDSTTAVVSGPNPPPSENPGSVISQLPKNGGGQDSVCKRCSHVCETIPDTKVKLNRVCSQRRSLSDAIFFEEAAHPILALEGRQPERHLRSYHKPFLASPGPASYMEVQKRPSILIQTIDLSKVDLFGPHFHRELIIGKDSIQNSCGRDWENLLVTAYVCDDTNVDGRCSDEDIRRQLSIRSPAFQLAHYPSALVIEVWSGRHFTRSSDPDLCEKQYSPLILDLTGEGFKLAGPENGVLFDLNDTGTPIHTGWPVGKNIAFLVKDIDENGQIQSGAELFGSATRLKNGARASNGFEALKDLDDNGDNRFSPDDSSWKRVRLWMDKNFNGRADRGEIVSLDRSHISSISLDYVEVMELDPYGNETRERSTFRRTIRGKSVPLQIIDIWFNTLVVQ